MCATNALVQRVHVEVELNGLYEPLLSCRQVSLNS